MPKYEPYFEARKYLEIGICITFKESSSKIRDIYLLYLQKNGQEISKE
jgi:hypothetical protein